ncbi:MAG: winged helix-turn-helix domain-containing protein [Myxococcales bacterium]|nr:winged helix-turn-helix domain-containing protein [Myxococcales bacterium]
MRALVFQGLACQCYFTGRYAGAARHALRALQAAHEAKFRYVAMLGTDMRGHALVQLGQLQRGIALLEQANRQAQRLGLTNNAFAVDTSIATYAARFVPEVEALARVEALLRRRAHDSYSRRVLLVEAAVQRALRGRRSEAVAALADADRDALRGDTRRGRVVALLARLWVTRWQAGPAACAALVAQARGLIEPRDVAFRCELLAFEILVARAAGDDDGVTRALDELRGLWRATQHFAAKAALGQFDAARPADAFDEDTLTPVLRAVAQRDATALSRVLALGLLGAVPELLGLAPGRRIILIPSEDLVLLEDHGDVIVRHRPPRWCPALLRILASGAATKERIVAGLWGLRAYHPELHDPPVRTTIHRLRTFLQPHGRWIEVGDDGYRTTVPVHLVSGAEPPPLDVAPLWDEGEIPSLRSHLAPAPVTAAPVAEPPQRVLQYLTEHARATVPEVARALELSPSTALRALRTLVGQRRVERVGFARATSYRLRPEA